MSVEAITWALKESVTPSSMKFVLVVLANCANTDTCEAYPSAAYLVEATCQDRKTVQSNIKRLIELGYIVDTGQRRGRTNQVIVYRLNCPWYTPLEVAQKRAPLKRPKIPVKEARFSPETGPKTGHGTQRKPKEPNTPLTPQGGQLDDHDLETGSQSGPDAGSGSDSGPVDRPDPAEGFAAFWAAWPVHDNKQGEVLCLQRWKRKRLHRFTASIVADVMARRASPKWVKGFIEAPAKYLKESRWMDAQPGVPTSALPWDHSRESVEAMGVRLGLGRWDEAEHRRANTQATMYHVYVARVRAEFERVGNGAD